MQKSRDAHAQVNAVKVSRLDNCLQFNFTVLNAGNMNLILWETRSPEASKED